MTLVAEPGPPALPALGDPLDRVLALGRRQAPIGVVIGLLGASFVHGAAAAKAVTSLFHLSAFAERAYGVVLERQRAAYDVDTTERPPTKVEEPEPAAPEPETKPAALRPTSQPTGAQPEASPPAAAEAGKVLTAEPDPDEPVDLTGDGFVSGPGERYAGGTTAATGTSKTAVRARQTAPGGAPGATGSASAAPAPAAAPAKDRARGAAPTSRSWNCGFPAEADFEQINYATVMIAVTVGTDGRAKSVSVLSDPGHGFGALARSCAMRMQYTVGVDANGQPTVKTTSPFPVRFTR